MEAQLATKSTQKEQAKKTSSSSSLQEKSPERATIHPILRLQRAIGNQAVQNMMRSRNVGLQNQQNVNRFAPKAKASISSTTSVLQRKCTCGGSSESEGECAECKAKREAPLQSSISNEAISPNLVINRPGDKYEQEADQVTEQVMHMPDSDAIQNARSSGHLSSIHIERLSPQSEEAHSQPVEEEEKEILQAKETPGRTPMVTPELQTRIYSLQGGGQPLPEATRAFVEPRFGFDFSQVRIHTDTRAAESARTVNASAYTLGRDVVFGAGQYKPETSKGRRLLLHELTHVVQQGQGIPVPGKETIFRKVEGIAVSDILDYDRLADKIYKAIAGWGTDEEAVYVALGSLQREQEAIDRLKATYKTKYGETLEEAIRGDFSGDELEYALQLINMGTRGSAQTIGAAPQTEAEFTAEAKRLHKATEGWFFTDAEIIFAVLTPLQRNVERISKLDEAYEKLYNPEKLRDRLVDKLSGSELDYALYLMGEQRMETTDISMDEAKRIFNALSHATFVTTTGGREPVPFHYPVDGCYDRAHVMTNILTQMGYASEKVFAVSQVSTPGGAVGGLRVPTPYAGNVPQGTQPAVEWWYHVAPVIRVRGTPALGQKQAPSAEMVIDPSLFDHPVTISEWTGKMSGGTFTRLSMDQLLAELAAHGGDYPVDKKLVFTTQRNVYFPPSLPFTPPTPSEAGTLHTANLPRMTTYADLARLHEVAAEIRRLLQVVLPGTPADFATANKIMDVIQAIPPAVRVQLWTRFPDLHEEVKKALPTPFWIE